MQQKNTQLYFAYHMDDCYDCYKNRKQKPVLKTPDLEPCSFKTSWLDVSSIIMAAFLNNCSDNFHREKVLTKKQTDKLSQRESAVRFRWHDVKSIEATFKVGCYQEAGH